MLLNLLGLTIYSTSEQEGGVSLWSVIHARTVGGLALQGQVSTQSHASVFRFQVRQFAFLNHIPSAVSLRNVHASLRALTLQGQVSAHASVFIFQVQQCAFQTKVPSAVQCASCAACNTLVYTIHYVKKYAARPGQLSEYMSSCFELLMLRYDVVGRRAIQVQFSGTCAIQIFVR